jgi:hypothetical protein
MGEFVAENPWDLNLYSLASRPCCTPSFSPIRNTL